jgi:hypothetical protein
MENIGDVLKWFGSGTGSIVVMAWVGSWLLDDLAAWNQLNAKLKKLIVLAAAVVLGLGAKALELNPGFYAAIEPYLDSIILIMGVWLSTQISHKVDFKRPGKPEGFG